MNQTPRKLKRGQDTKIPQSSGPPEKVGDEAVHKELGDRMERAATTAFSLEAEQDSDKMKTNEIRGTNLGLIQHYKKLQDQSHGALDLGFKVLWSKNEGTDKVLEGTAQEYESTAGANLGTDEVNENTVRSCYDPSCISTEVKGKLSTKEDFVSFREMINITSGEAFDFMLKFPYYVWWLVHKSMRAAIYIKRILFIQGDDYISTLGEALAL
ncbi:hypothetical protein Tco_1394659 [Tanacetum coccineum]